MLNYALALAAQIAENNDNGSNKTQSGSNRDDSNARIDLISTDKL
jgi:hypothetical protein